MAIFAGPERLTFIDIDRKSGSVTELVEIAEKYIRSNIRWRVVFNGSIQRMLKLGFAVVFYRPDENFLAPDKTSDDRINVRINDPISARSGP
jgi:hypothetical protein